ncbi:SnoaL-like domain-containing protein [Algicella marina]|uniref:Nuclear transport factor 2 family protein n=1 Tax=Algicella marina TaxID=2683284 RepID=A0A6P1T5I7_9RHOB|nr:SnoaL-like domain-containing protein [Algicella marina]QHQ36970.1 nuclear transport factor 2 family protein [Algicella marina]
MAREALKQTAETLVEYCRTGQEEKGLEELYAPDAVSVEPMAMPGTDSRETEGVEGIKGKHLWWSENFEVHGGDVQGPYFHGDDRFAVIFEIDATEKSSGKREKMKEVGLYTIDAAGKIRREEFFY